MTWKILSFVSIILMISSANSAVIECTWSGETCNLNTGTLISQPNEVITISGKPAGYVNTVTTFLPFNDRFLIRYFPSNIFPIFTNLQWLYMSNCGMTYLTANFSKTCPVLNHISIDDGFIQDIPEGFLQTCSNLNLISIMNNEIKTIDKNAFRGLAKLENIQLHRNKLTCLHPDLFQHTPLLLRVSFNYNKINALDRNLLRNLQKIGFLEVKYNALSYLPTFNLTASAYMAFYANGNPINAINPTFCSIFTNKMHYIYIKGIPCLPKDTLFYRIDKQNCLTSASILQSCYANWVPTMANDVACGQGSGACIPANVWSKFAEFVKYLPI